MTEIFQQMTDALGIMILGMGLVFVFLSILILGVTLVAKWCTPTISAQPILADNHQVSQCSHTMEPKLLAAITAAIHQYRAQA